MGLASVLPRAARLVHRDYATPTRRADNPRAGRPAFPVRPPWGRANALAVPGVEALEKPSRAEIARYRQDGSLRARRERAYELGNHQVKPGLVAEIGRASCRERVCNGV